MALHAESAEPLDAERLAERLGVLCRQRRILVSAAESCTGGGVSSAITAIAGSSEYFETGYVTYSNGAKQRLLGVDESLLTTHGAVSRPVVEAMVTGACADSGADLTVAISGVAGPAGGTPEKPVGTVWLAWGNQWQCSAECLHLTGDREAVRQAAVKEALAGLVRWLSADD
ncbi:CinA family protein [Halomonas sp. 18H]|nr:CinA family protein [Halomonas sp. 18H]MCW4149684.1 CinA family protein [Halomonas sp. 18H]